MPNSRREFMRTALATGSIVAIHGAHANAASNANPSTSEDHVEVKITRHNDPYDIVVIGSGTAGTIAAIQAGRLGMRTLLVEKNGMPGGTTIVAAVNFPGLFHAWGHQVIAGIGWELVTNTVEACGETLPDFTSAPERHWQQQVRVNRAIYASVACEALHWAGVEVLFHSMPAAVKESDNGFEVTLCTKSGLQQIHARSIIDASGDANAVSMAGYPVNELETKQPGTLILTLDGYDFDALNKPQLQLAFQQALEDGELLQVDQTFVRNNVVHFLGQRGDNCTHITNIDGRTSAGRSVAEMHTRMSLLRVFRFLRRQPGLENFEITFMAPECGIRETVTIQGEATITHQDYVEGRLWDDAICYSFYPIDLHYAAGGGIDTRPLTPGTFPSVPRGALVPKGSKRLLVAGRALSSDREANSALRVQASCMAYGQAAAVLAEQAVMNDCSVMDTELDKVHTVLREHNAIVPDMDGPPMA